MTNCLVRKRAHALIVLFAVGLLVLCVGCGGTANEELEDEATQDEVAVEPIAVDTVHCVFPNTSGDFVIIRETPDANGPILGVLKNGHEGATCLEVDDGWIKVDCFGIVGYVCSKDVQDTLLVVSGQSLSPEYVLSQTSDTLVYEDYCFVSQCIPDTVKTRMQGKSMLDDATIGFDQLRYLTIFHYDYQGDIKTGEMVCNKIIAHELLCIFRALFSREYPIESIRLVDDFEASDEKSMEANNTSCFNFRNVPGTRVLSCHALGMAVDVNPLQNPYVRGMRIQPETSMEYADRDKKFEHKIDEDDFCKMTFTSFGFQWGGNWRNAKDYQHFEKRK